MGMIGQRRGTAKAGGYQAGKFGPCFVLSLIFRPAHMYSVVNSYGQLSVAMEGLATVDLGVQNQGEQVEHYPVRRAL